MYFVCEIETNFECLKCETKNNKGVKHVYIVDSLRGTVTAEIVLTAHCEFRISNFERSFFEILVLRDRSDHGPGPRGPETRDPRPDERFRTPHSPSHHA